MLGCVAKIVFPISLNVPWAASKLAYYCTAMYLVSFVPSYPTNDALSTSLLIDHMFVLANKRHAEMITE